MDLPLDISPLPQSHRAKCAQNTNSLQDRRIPRQGGESEHSPATAALSLGEKSEAQGVTGVGVPLHRHIKLRKRKSSPPANRKNPGKLGVPRELRFISLAGFERLSTPSE